MRDVAPTAHFQMLRHPSQGLRRFGPQPAGHFYFLRVAFAPSAQFVLLPSQAFEFLRDEAPGFLLAGLESIRAVRVGPHPIGLGRQQFPPKFFPAQAPRHNPPRLPPLGAAPSGAQIPPAPPGCPWRCLSRPTIAPRAARANDSWPSGHICG
jgi:hypothetical protein